MYNTALIVDLTKKAKFTVPNQSKIIPKKNSWELSLGMVKTIPKKFCQEKIYPLTKVKGYDRDYATSFFLYLNLWIPNSIGLLVSSPDSVMS